MNENTSTKITNNRQCPILGFAAWSGTGKTTLLKKLIPQLKQHGIRIGMIKHAHHQFDIDTPGKDSYELRKAGAEQMLVASSQRWALMTERRLETDDLDLNNLIARLDQKNLDLILVEGFRHEKLNKIELFRPEMNKPALFPEDDAIIAIASNQPEAIVFKDNKSKIPILDLNNTKQIVDYIIAIFNLST
ncbi:MAG: molybdopterin-guanine dinucleotide biosynthesis protein B [Gammaproteobacteria bacterium]|nr:molybdopterin-guanine dinucleotide biosynthesis protein B [Gammaproteobacteria bacterium]